MRILTHSDRIFDTQVDTRKIFVPMKHKFYLRDHVGKDGKSLIYLRISHAGEVKRIPLPVYAQPKGWNKTTQRLSDPVTDAQNVNLILDNIESKITSIKTHFWLTETTMSIDKFVKEFQSGIPRLDFVAFFEYELNAQIDNVHPNTQKKQKSVLKAVREFRSKIMFSDLDKSLIDKFCIHRKKQGLKSTSINSNLAIIKKFVKIARNKGIKMAIQPEDIKVGNTSGNRESLTPAEFNLFRNYFKSGFIRDNHRWPLAKFLFSCYTGMRVSDVQNITEENIHNGFVKFESVKTGKKQKIKLAAEAIDILSKCPEFFVEQHTDQHINRILKDICNLLGIRTKVTFHYGRHTFATNFLRSGGKVEVLQQLLAHSSIEQTMIYVTILQEQMDDQIMLLDNIKIIPDSRF